MTPVIDVLFGAAGVLSAGVAVSLFLGSRRHREILPWRSRLIPSPRLLSGVFGLLAAAWVALFASRLVLRPDSGGQRAGIVVAWLLFVGAALTHLKWLRRPAPSRRS